MDNDNDYILGTLPAPFGQYDNLLHHHQGRSWREHGRTRQFVHCTGLLSLMMMSPSYRLFLLPCRVSRLLPPSLSRRQSVLSAAPRRPRRRHAPERLGKKERKKSHPLTLHIYPQCDRALYLSSFPHRDRIRNFASLGRSWANVSLSTSLSVIIV